MGRVFLCTAGQASATDGTLLPGLLAALAALAPFPCTAMVCASIRYLQGWTSTFMLVNHTLLGLASGRTLDAALAAWGAPKLVPTCGSMVPVFALAGGASGSLSLARHAWLEPRSTVLHMLQRRGADAAIGLDRIISHQGDALRAVHPQRDPALCRGCSLRAFEQCRVALPDGSPLPPLPASPRAPGTVAVQRPHPTTATGEPTP